MGPEGTDIVVIGAGGFGREVVDLIEAAAEAGASHRFVGFVDDGEPDLDLLAAGGAVLLDGLEDPRVDGAEFVIGIGDPTAKARVDARLVALGLAVATLVHPQASIGSQFVAGEGLVAGALVSITTNVRFGRHVHLNPGVTVGHDCRFGDHVSVFPNATISGSIELGDRVTVGAGSVIIQGVTVGEGTTIGAGSVVTRDLPPGVIAMGSPAKPVREVG